MITVNEMVESGKCPCEVCSSQDEKRDPLDKSNEKLSLGRLVNKKSSNLIRIDTGLHRLLKIKAADERTTIRTLVEGALADLLSVEGSKENV